MQDFLRYVAQNKPEGDFANRLEKAVDIARLNPRWRSEYMNLEEIIEERGRLLQEQIDQLSQENNTLVQEKDKLSLEKDRISLEKDKISKEKEAADLRIAELEKLLSAYTKSEH